MADSRKGAGLGAWSMVAWLLLINGVIFLLQHGVFNHQITSEVFLNKEALFRGEVWRLLTFQFFHSGIGLFLSTMLGLFFPGRAYERLVGSRHLLLVYLIGGLVGGMTGVAFEGLFNGGPLIGASASVIAIITALVVTMPEHPVSLLFLPIQIRIKYLGWGLLVLNVAGLLITGGSSLYIAHLGAMVAGWLFVKAILPAISAKKAAKTPASAAKKRSKIAEAAEEQIKKKRQKETIYLNKKVDYILEKISKEGMQSLTEEEKSVLERSSAKLSRKQDGK